MPPFEADRLQDDSFWKRIRNIFKAPLQAADPLQTTHTSLYEKALAENKLDTALIAVLQELDAVSEFAISVLNPFPTLAELHSFARSINYGKNSIIYFEQSPGLGEKIQARFIAAFLKKFFPELDIVYFEDEALLPLEKKKISVQMLDYLEMPHEKIAPYPQFSMIQTKILHSQPCSESTAAQLKTALLTQIAEQCREQGLPFLEPNAPIIIGPIDDELRQKFKKPTRVLSTHSGTNIITSTLFFSPSQPPIEEAKLTPSIKLFKRALYAIADYACIRMHDNKLEAVQARAQVLVLKGNYLHQSNPNFRVDQFLSYRGKVLPGHMFSPTEEFVPPVHLDQEDIAQLYSEYLSAIDTPLSSEPPLQKSMLQLIQEME